MQADASIRELSTAPTANRGKPLLIPQTTRPAIAEPIILHDLIPLDARCDPHDPTGEASLNSIPARNDARDLEAFSEHRYREREAPAEPRPPETGGSEIIT
jgi:hypothetical protein